MKIQYSKNNATNFSIEFIENPSKYVTTCDICNREAHIICVVSGSTSIFCISCFEEMKSLVETGLKLYNNR